MGDSFRNLHIRQNELKKRFFLITAAITRIRKYGNEHCLLGTFLFHANGENGEYNEPKGV